MIFTIVHSATSNTKFPTSTLEDPKIFEFENKEIFGMREVAGLFKKYYILNFPLRCSKQSSRKSAFLERHIADSSEYMILDFNDVQDKDSRDLILQRFKPFRHVSFKTKSSDDLFSFNFRIVLCIPSSTRSKILQDTKKLAKLLDPKLAKINTSLYRKAQITASGHNGILTCNEDGFLFNLDEFKDAMCWQFTPDIRQVCLGLFKELGFEVRDEYKESAILVNEQMGDFVFFDSNPFQITNVITGERVDIQKEFKRRYKIENFRSSIPVKELLDWGNKERIYENKSVELGSLDSANLNAEINSCISNEGCLVLRSPMGSGKTRVIRDFMNKSNSCLIITPRVSLADEFYERFKEDGVRVYNKHKLEKDTRLFICQFDSLYKIDTKVNHFDTIIIDEFMTLCEHITSSIASNREHNLSKMLALMNKSRSMMICDAFMEKIALDLIPTKFKNVIWVSNETKDPTNVIIHKDVSSFLQSIVNNRAGGLVVSCVSVSAGLSIKHFLESAGVEVGLINSGTSMEVRNQILEDYKLAKLGAIVYSPSVSVGVNVMGLRGSHYHYDPGNVIPVIQSIQMIRRSRNSGSIECFIKRVTKNFVPSLEEEKFNILQGNDTISGVVFNEDGDRSLSPVGRFLAILKYHRKLWNIDSSKTFARLCSLNFNSVTSINSKTKCNLSLTNYQNIKEFAETQKLEIFGEKSQRVREVIEPKDIDSFLNFEKFYRITKRLEGYELCMEDLVRQANFGLSQKLNIFNKMFEGIPVSDYNKSKDKLPKEWIEKSKFWNPVYKHNSKFLELCEYLHCTEGC